MEEAKFNQNGISEQVYFLFQELKEELGELKQRVLFPKTTEYLTPKEVAQLLKCDLSTVSNWRKSGKLIRYGISGRVYYKLSEVEQALIRI